MNTGRVINRRYLLQHVIERGTACTIYQGEDHALRRPVAVKVVPTEHIPAYRAAIRATAQLAHPNITGLFDVIQEPETLYIVQEHIIGDTFAKLLRSNLTLSEVTDLGIQICRALIYAGTSSHKTCHGDLTPSSIIRDSTGHIRINNFALPSDIQYFTAWSTVGSGGFVLSDPELPCGQISEGRRGDDTRAVGILLYQLLAARSADATQVEPPMDGRLRFQRHVPPELCEVIARSIVRIHPQRIPTAESLYTELKHITEALEAISAPEVTVPPGENIPHLQPSMPPQAPLPTRPTRQTGNLVSTLPSRDFPAAALRKEDPSRTTADAPLATAVPPSPVSDMSMKLVAARPTRYSSLSQMEMQPRKVGVPAIILMGLIFFAVFFGIGFLIARIVLQ